MSSSPEANRKTMKRTHLFTWLNFGNSHLWRGLGRWILWKNEEHQSPAFLKGAVRYHITQHDLCLVFTSPFSPTRERVFWEQGPCQFVYHCNPSPLHNSLALSKVLICDEWSRKKSFFQIELKWQILFLAHWVSSLPHKGWITCRGLPTLKVYLHGETTEGEQQAWVWQPKVPTAAQ
jgi:hypothetical protein